MNYYDILLAKKLEDDRDPQVVGLSVTENGTYAEEGKVYKPVVVNVPLGSKSITANGVYNAASDNLKGYSSVDVHVEGYKITDVSGLPSPIATFSDASALPMPKLEVAIEPQQDLHGYDAPWVGGAGKNKLNISDYTARSFSDYGIATTVNGDDVTVTITSYPIQQTSQSFAILINSLPNIDKTNLSVKAFISAGSNYVSNVRWANAASNNNIAIDLQNLSQGLNATITMRVMVYETSGGEPTTYSPYTNICPISGWDEVDLTVADDVETPTVENVYTIDLNGTRYGGKLDVVSGVLTVDRGYIASYNGETLPSTWISDRDVYAEGTTPTIGAEVVYTLATPTTIQLTPTAVKSLLGTNNLWADTGDVVEASYWEEL